MSAMRVSLDIRKNVIENANHYFDRAKSYKKKSLGAREAVAVHERKLADFQKKHEEHEKKQSINDEKSKKEKADKELLKQEQKWFHKFRWFMSSQGILVIGGRDATTNEIIIKKYTDNSDIVLHTDIAGSPFVVLKLNDEATDKSSTTDPEKLERSIREAAIFCATYSKAWKLGVSSIDVFHVKPEQVTKEAAQGEYMQKGSFMIYGKKNYVRSGVQLAVCITKYGVMASPLSAAEANSVDGNIVMVEQGSDKTSDVAKKIQRVIGGDLDELVKIVPAGGAKVGRVIKFKK